jgi:hypothetical protein
MTRRSHHPAACAAEREVGVVAAVLVAGSEKAAAHRLGPSHFDHQAPPGERAVPVGAETTAQLVWILGSRLPQREGMAGVVE